jgi:hypothetical protein
MNTHEYPTDVHILLNKFTTTNAIKLHTVMLSVRCSQKYNFFLSTADSNLIYRNYLIINIEHATSIETKLTQQCEHL